MASLSRRVFLVALLVAAVAAVFASAACDSNCGSCVLDVCVKCKSGYYFGVNGCTPCGAAHCDRCEAVGWCLSCQAGYRLQYVANTENPTINRYGTCVNAASIVGAPAALIAATVALVYAVVA